MKKSSWLLAGAAALELIGCNSGEVLMSKAQPAAGTAPSYSQARSSSGPAAAQDPIVYFDRVTVRDSKPETLIGLGFLREGALTQDAFGLRFKASGAFAGRPRLEADAAGVLYLKPDGAGYEHLLSLDPSTLNDAEIARLPTGLRELAVSEDLKSLAWIDARGKVSAVFDGAAAASVAAPAGDALDVKFTAGSDQLQLRVAGGSEISTLIFAGDGSASETVAGAPFARENVGGRTAVGSLSPGLGLQIADPRTGTQLTVPLEGVALHDLRWSDDGRLAALVEDRTGALSLFSVRPETGQTELIARLGLPASAAADRIVCPAWYGGALYYGDASGSSYAIFRADSAGGGWQAEPFARTATPTQGFVCPKVSRTAGGRT